MAITKTSWSQLNTVATPEFMSRIEGSDRFTAERVGQIYSIGDILTTEPKVATDAPIHRLVIKRGFKHQEWYLKGFLKYVRIMHEGELITIPQWCHITGKEPFTSFKVVAFKPDTDDFGHHVYSREIQDPAKKAKLYSNEMHRLEDKDMSVSERIAFNNKCNANVLALAYDQYLVNGQITPEASKKFQLGILTIEPVL